MSNKGFTHVAFIVFLVVAAGIGSIAYVVHNRQQTASQTDETSVVSQTVPDPAVPAAPEINDDADLDKTEATLDQVDPSVENQADSTAIDDLAKDL